MKNLQPKTHFVAIGLAFSLVLVGGAWILGAAAPTTAPRAVPPESAETRTMMYSDTLEDGIGTRSLVMISPPVVPVEPAASVVVRYVSLTIQFHRNSISPKHSWAFRPMAVDGNEAISFGTRALNPARIQREAARELSITLPDDVMADAMGLTQGPTDIMYQIDLRPAEGKTWGDVVAEEDLQLSITVEG